MARLQSILDSAVEFIWGPQLLIPLLLATGVYLTVRLGGLQFRTIGHALWLAFFRRSEKGASEGDVSHYQALATALAATVGVGNIAGVATAIQLGGPGALFWMWVTGLAGMATKYSEALLGVMYRRPDSRGEMSGGPMFYLRYGLAERTVFGVSLRGLGAVLGAAFALFGAVAAFGIGNLVQANTVAAQLDRTWDIPAWATGAVLLAATAAVGLGGIRSIGRFAGAFVPFMCVAYMLANIAVLLVFLPELPGAAAMVVTDAFTGTAAAGGFAGATLMAAVQYGVARGIFSNESGLGTGGIAASAARTDQPVRQGMVSMTQTFIDTLIMVTLTALAIIVTGAWRDSGLKGAPMTSWALDQALPGQWGSYIIAVGVLVFAFTTILGWCYYGERCMDFLLGRRAVLPYRLAFVAVVFVGATSTLELAWAFADIANGLMALPNLVGLLLLSPVVAAATRAYFANPNWRDPDASPPLVDVR
ncbi:alanine/glycine:cation symporter family protein [Marinitenerispora sediminis]|uniref:Sodium:alanine symporter family protein n=1 Tax=Marinitenerispora sediminis TaxID=1931232 RepID=A0A368T1W5_9ACTN|nr:sodium:alanine symporter family protein [Marinitenerispora sediminis]RCV52739.1 sodium:alanine symporter family protein [Marinitenerispora sediminis]RCV54259.1 sodium:alanine symporter family protein [Marinitenerispora sediminis]RCV54834.1 sodium:alanine symporter family protein [Marinitenerispora sediminis]